MKRLDLKHLHKYVMMPLKAFFLCSLLFSSIVNADENDLANRLTKLSEALEKQRKSLHIPGFAIAIVKDDKVILSKGFGVSDLEKNTPITPETLFAIGSTSKAFTASLVGMQIDKGKMTWDDQATKHLPYYTFEQDNKLIELTIRDMLSHRSGYSRNDILWVNGEVASKDILKDATKAEPWAAFRKRFNYNNVMYLAAGMASAKQDDMSWNAQLDTLLLKPLGMNNTTADYDEVQKSPLLSSGYMWREEAKAFKKLPMRNLNNIAPAGAINSNVIDMSNWIKFQLNKGVFNNQRLLSEKQINETRSAQIKIAENIYYGLGWFLRDWQGQPVVEHGGNIDGFGAQVTLFPESNLGYVLLTNVTATPLQQLSINMVAEHLLSEPPQESQEQATDNKNSYSEFTGEYIGNFGPFKQATFKTLLKDGKLAVDVPGQTVYTLKQPNEEGKWQFDLTDTIAVSFERNQNNQISAMRLHQNGMNFELPKKGVPIIPEIDPNELQKYLGSYYSKHLKSETKALIQNHRLALDVPGQMVYELHLPDEEGRWKFRISPNLHVTFDSEDNKITSINFFKNDKQNGKMPRVKGEVENTLPTLKDLLTLRNSQTRKKALQEAKGINIKGTVFFAQAGLSGQLNSYQLSDTHVRVELDLGKYGYIHTAVNPASAAALKSFPPFFETIEGKYLEQEKRLLMFDNDWSSIFDEIHIVKNSKLGEKKVYVVLLKDKQLPTITAYVDVSNGDVLKQETSLMLPGMGSMPYSLTFEDYRDVDGLRIPFKITSKDQQRGNIIFQYQSLKTGLTLKPELFELKDTQAD